MTYIQNFILSVMEITSLFILWNKISNNFKKQTFIKKIIVVLSSAFITVYTDSCDIYYGFIINYIFLICFSWLLFKIPIKNILLLFLISLSIAIGIELIIFLFLSFFVTNSSYTFIQGIIINSTLILFCCILSYYLPLQKINILYKKYNKIFGISLLNIGVISLTFIYFLQNQTQTFNWKYTVFPLLIGIIWSAINLYFLYQNIKIQKQKEIIFTYNQYQKSLVELIDEVRQKQHDYKNHLNTLYGLAQLQSSNQIQQELATYLEQYIFTIQDTDQILNIKDPTLSALIYSKKKVAQNQEIEFKLHFINEIPNYPLQKYELVEIIGNLLDNAIEAASDTKKHLTIQPRISITLGTKENKKFFQVKNTFYPSQNFSPKQLFIKNFSTKNKGANNRGYGLYIVKKIVDANNGMIIISMTDVEFEVEITFDI